jgi:hypothetical protein
MGDLKILFVCDVCIDASSTSPWDYTWSTRSAGCAKKQSSHLRRDTEICLNKASSARVIGLRSRFQTGISPARSRCTNHPNPMFGENICLCEESYKRQRLIWNVWKNVTLFASRQCNTSSATRHHSNLMHMEHEAISCFRWPPYHQSSSIRAPPWNVCIALHTD